VLIQLLSIVAAMQAPELFGAGVITKPDSEKAFGSFSPDGREFYFTLHRPDFSRHRIMMSRLEGDRWSAPRPLPFSGQYNDREPKLSPDGRRLFFSSNRPTQPGDTVRRRDLDLWFVDRAAKGAWSSPRHIDAPVNTAAQEFSPSVTASGTLYFISRRAGGIGRDDATYNVWRARPVDAAKGVYAAPENLGAAINNGTETNVYVTPDEHLMFVSRDGSPDGLGGDDLYMAERKDDVWQPMRHLAAPINTAAYEYGPMVSPDGKWLYFTSHRLNGAGDIYRVPLSAVKPEAEEIRAEREAVHRAVSDYLEGFYEGDTAKLARSLRPELSKYGFERAKDSATYTGEAMSFAEAIAYATRFKAQKRTTPANAPREITIFEVQNQTASAKVHAWWGTDYLLLGKYDGRWMIAHVMWQSPPKNP
jgi:Putative lumazine-binding/WD40-like Beta Propeller Repeat